MFCPKYGKASPLKNNKIGWTLKGTQITSSVMRNHFLQKKDESSFYTGQEKHKKSCLMRSMTNFEKTFGRKQDV